MKKNIGGSPTGKRVEAPQALTCNTNTGVRIDPQELKSTETWGSKKSLGGLNPPSNPPPRQIGPCMISIHANTLRLWACILGLYMCEAAFKVMQ